MINEKEKNIIDNFTQGEPIGNRDIHPSKGILSVYPELAPIFESDMVADFFDKVDIEAVKRKKLFVKLGTVSLVLFSTVLTLLSWRLSLAKVSVNFNFWFEFCSALIGLSAVCIQIFLFFSKLHRKWLYSRFIAEMIRLWKFQLLLDGNFISNYFQSPDDFKKEFEKKWAFFEEKRRNGFGEMEKFINSQPLELMIKPSPYKDVDLIKKIKEIYLRLRLDVQITHFDFKNTELETLDKLTESWAKVLLMFSGLFAVLEACLMVFQVVEWLNFADNTGLLISAILSGLSLSFAIISAAIRVYRSASSVSEDRERYRYKESHLNKIRTDLQDENDPLKVLHLMEETETVCMQELQEFLILLRRADYFF